MDGPLKSLKLYFEKGKIGYDTSYVHLVSVPLKMGSDIYKKEKHIESAFAFISQIKCSEDGDTHNILYVLQDFLFVFDIMELNISNI